MDGLYPEPFPKNFDERLKRFIDLADLSSEEFAERLGVDDDRVME